MSDARELGEVNLGGPHLDATQDAESEHLKGII